MTDCTLPSDFEHLTITHQELERLTGLEISDVFLGRAFRPTLLGKRKQFLALLMTELLTFVVILIFTLPITLVLVVYLNGRSIPTHEALRFLPVAFGAAIAILVLWNLYLVLQGRNLRTLGHLIEQVEHHNEMVLAVRIIDELSAVNTEISSICDRDEILQALTATRESLIAALMTEKILRRHQRFIARRHELFAQIETNLATLQRLQVHHQAAEYGELLNEALRIGLVVRQEVQQLRDR